LVFADPSPGFLVSFIAFRFDRFDVFAHHKECAAFEAGMLLKVGVGMFSKVGAEMLSSLEDGAWV